MIVMGTIQSSESFSFADYLRSQRTMTQTQVDETERMHDARDLTPSERRAILEGSK
jgi:hypothetical protein